MEQRLRQLYPEMMAHFDHAVQNGSSRQDAMQTAARYLPDTLRRAGDGALTSSVRGGPIGVNRIDLPTTQILLAGRGMREADPQRLREAVDHHRPATAIGNLRRLAGDQTVTGYYRAIVAQNYQLAFTFFDANAVGPDGQRLTLSAFLQLAQSMDGAEGPVTDFSANSIGSMIVMTNYRKRMGPFHAHLQIRQTGNGWRIVSLDRI